MPETRHATAVEMNGSGILISGPSGAGKSDLALRLIDGGARLIADDLVRLDLRDGLPWASPPDGWQGVMEVRGLGILQVGGGDPAPVRLVIDLAAAVDRLPEPRSTPILGVPVATVALDPWPASAVAKVRLAVGIADGSILPVSGHIPEPPPARAAGAQ